MARILMVLLAAAACSPAKPAADPAVATVSSSPVAWTPSKLPENASRCVSIAQCIGDVERSTPLACERFGDLVDNGGLAAAGDLAALKTVLESRCQADAACCGEAARLQCDPPGPGSWSACKPAARALFERGCSGGDVYACMGLSIVLRRGLGVSADGEAAQRILDRATEDASGACDRGDGHSCGLASQLLYVASKDRSASEASQRFDVAAAQWCDAGDGLACASLGRSYDSDEHGARDEAKAKHYLERACKLGVELQGCQ